MGSWKNRKKYVSSVKRENTIFSVHLDKMTKRELIITVIAIFAVVIACFSSAYAYMVSVQKSKNYNTLKVGNLAIDYDDTSNDLGNIINLNGTYPMSDSDGEKTKPYKFKITNTGTLEANYTIKIIDDSEMIKEDNCANNLLNPNFIKISINGKEPILLSNISSLNNVLIKGKLVATEEKVFSIRMWIDSNADNSVLGKHYHGKIEVDAENETGTLAYKKIFNDSNLGHDASLVTDDNSAVVAGKTPNNYVMFDDLLYRAFSLNKNDNSIKLITNDIQNNLIYKSNLAFKDSNVYEYLNNKSEGFLMNIKNYEYLNNAYSWNSNNLNNNEVLNASVGLITSEEYKKTSINGESYLDTENNFLLMPTNDSNLIYMVNSKQIIQSLATEELGIRPCIVLNNNVRIKNGDGTVGNPYIIK